MKELKEHYQKGGLGDVVLKKRLITLLNNFLEPIRKKRKELEQDPKYIMDVLFEGTFKTQEVAAKTLAQVKQAMKLIYK